MNNFQDPFNTPAKKIAKPVNNDPQRGTGYDEIFIYAYTDKLLKQADRIVITLTILFGIIGALLGFLVGGRGSGSIILAVISGVIGAVIGYIVGTQRAFWLRLEAHRSLWMIQVEKHLRNINRQTRSS